jgi:hypothetical protein
MTYMVSRRFRGQQGIDPADLDRTVGKELVPQIRGLPGFMRYVTVMYDDGMIGSVTVMQNEDSIRRSDVIARKWAAESPAMRSLTLATSITGKAIATVEAGTSLAPGFTIQRLYRSDASESAAAQAFAPVLEAFRQHAAGLVRYMAVLVPGGQLATLGWFDSADHAAASSQVARDLIRQSPDLGKVLPNPPEEIATGRMLTVYT